MNTKFRTAAYAFVLTVALAGWLFGPRGASAADQIDWAQWVVNTTGTNGSATGNFTSHGTMSGVFTNQTLATTLPTTSTFGLSAFSTVLPPQTFYGIVESPNANSTSRDTFNLTGITGAGTDKLVFGLSDLKYDLTGPFNGPVTVKLTAFDNLNNQIPLNSVSIREQANHDTLISLLLNGQDLNLSYVSGSVMLEVNPYDNTRNYSHSLMALLDGFPTGISTLEVLHANPDTAFIDGIHMGFGIIVPEPASIVMAVMATSSLAFIGVQARRKRRRLAA